MRYKLKFEYFEIEIVELIIFSKLKWIFVRFMDFRNIVDNCNILDFRNNDGFL